MSQASTRVPVSTEFLCQQNDDILEKCLDYFSVRFCWLLSPIQKSSVQYWIIIIIFIIHGPPTFPSKIQQKVFYWSSKKKETKQNPDFKNRSLGNQVYLGNDSHFSLAINETRNYCFLGFVHMISNCSKRQWSWKDRLWGLQVQNQWSHEGTVELGQVPVHSMGLSSRTVSPGKDLWGLISSPAAPR